MLARYAYLAAHGFVPSVMTVEAEAELLDTCRALDPRTVGSRLADSVVEEGEELRSSLMDAFIRRQRYASPMICIAKSVK